MNRKGITKISLVVLVLATVLIGNYFVFAKDDSIVISNSWRVVWRDCQHGLTQHSCIVDIQNLDPAIARDFNLSLLFNSTNYEITKTEATIKEWKSLPTQVDTYNTVLVPQTCQRMINNLTGANESYDCSYNQTTKNGTVTQNLVQWKDTKTQLTKTGANLKASYGNINVPKFNSKEKYDDKNNTETFNGTKTFKVEWTTPIVSSLLGWGNSGLIAFVDLITNAIYHPWWDVNAAAKTNVTFENNAGSSLTDFPMLATANITGDIKSCIDAVWVNQSETEVLRYELENNTCTANNNSVWWVRTPVLSSSIVNETYWLYHNFTSPTDQSNTYGTWSSNYAGVYHMGDISTTQQLNSKGGALPNGTIASSAWTEVNGKFGRGLAVVGGTMSGLTIASGWSTTNGANTENYTAEFWFKDNVSTSSIGVLALNYGVNQIVFYVGQGANKNQTRLFTAGGGADTTPSQTYQTQVWNYVVITFDGYTTRIFLNGASIVNVSVTADLPTGTSDITVGCHNLGGVPCITGAVDEFRISFVNVSAFGGEAYVKANYNLGKAYFNSISIQSDTTPPTLTIISPTNTTYTNPNITLQVTSNEAMSQWWYKLINGANTTFIPNTTFIASEGFNNLTIYGNDTAGNIGSKQVNFTLDTTPPSITISSPTSGTRYLIGTNVDLNWTIVNETPDWAKYELDGAANASLMGNWCYQESVNVSTSCGGLSTGVYWNSTGWGAADLVLDGNWSSYDQCGIAQGECFVYMNYTKPSRALPSSIWQNKMSANITLNVSIPTDCWNNNATVLSFRVNSRQAFDTPYYAVWSYCRNGTSWLQIQDSDPIGGDPAYRFAFEEAMWWNISTAKNVTLTGLSSGSHDIKIFANDTLGNMGNSSNVTFYMNTAPTLSGLTISPDPANKNSVFNISVLVNDSEGDGATVNFTVMKNSLQVQNYTGAYANNTNITFLGTGWTVVKGDNISVIAIANDTAVGTAVSTTNLTISNIAPTLAGLSMSPSQIWINSTLTASVVCTDADSDLCGITFMFYNNSISVFNVTNSSIASGTNVTATYTRTKEHFGNLSVKANATDGTDVSNVLSTGNLTVLNLNPTTDTPTITPSPAYEADTLTCNPQSNADGDGDTVTNTYQWYKEVALIAGQTVSTLANTQFSHYENITCEVKPYDGTVYGSSMNSTALQIGNTAPVLASLSMSPPQVWKNTSVVTASVKCTDADSDTCSTMIQAFLDGLNVFNVTNSSIASGTNITATFTFGWTHFQNLSFRANGTDGNLNSNVLSIGNYTILDVEPILASPSISPIVININSTLIGAVMFTDLDLDLANIDWEVMVNSINVANYSSTSVANGTNATKTFTGITATHFSNVSFRAKAYTYNLNSGWLSTGNITVSDLPPTVSTYSFNQTGYSASQSVNLSFVVNDIDLDTINVSGYIFNNAINVQNFSYKNLATNNTNITVITNFALTRYNNISYQMNITSNLLSAQFNTTNITILNSIPLIDATKSSVNVSYVNYAGKAKLMINATDLDGTADINSVWTTIDSPGPLVNETFFMTKAGTDTWELNYTYNITQGTWTFKTRANDTSNAIATEKNFSFYVDTTKPNIFLNKSDTGVLLGQGVNLTFNFEDTNLNITSTANKIYFLNPDGTLNFQRNLTGNTTIEFNSSLTGQTGNYTLNLTTIDLAGNTNSSTLKVGFGKINITLATRLIHLNYQSESTAWDSPALSSGRLLNISTNLTISIVADGELASRTNTIHVNLTSVYGNWTVFEAFNTTNNVTTSYVGQNVTWTSDYVSTGQSFTDSIKVNTNNGLNYTSNQQTASTYRFLVATDITKSFNEYVRVSLPSSMIFDKGISHPRYFVCKSNPTRAYGCSVFSSGVDVTSSNTGSNSVSGYDINMKAYDTTQTISELSYQTNHTDSLIEVSIVSGPYAGSTTSPSPPGGGGGAPEAPVETPKETTLVCNKDGESLFTYTNGTQVCVPCPNNFKPGLSLTGDLQCEKIGPAPADVALQDIFKPRFLNGTVSIFHILMFIIGAIILYGVKDKMPKMRRKIL